uniref:Cytokine dependent hematopoietic cell linker n=1 Tax=Equus asinus asinus TaxID=83772 RepID=A0A8C4L815_EQUAS
MFVCQIPKESQAPAPAQNSLLCAVLENSSITFPHFARSTVKRPGVHLPAALLCPGYLVLSCHGRCLSRTFLDGTKGHDDDYEDPECHVVEAWQSMKILPARPIKESEYADTRYFKGVMDTALSSEAKTSIPTEGQTWNMRMRPEEVSKGLILPQCDSSHRPPITLPKKYQPLPPEPESSRSAFPQRHTFPEAKRQPRTIQRRFVSRGRWCGVDQKVATDTRRSNGFQLLVGGRWPETVRRSYSNVHLLFPDHKESMQSHSPQRRQSPGSSSSQENLLYYKNTSWRKKFPARSDEKDVQHNEWYIGEYSRQAVEEALMKEYQDGTFLVRDCSTKSRAEPYVLAVFYGNKVYNVKIRFLERNRQFALGTGLRGEEKFDSVEDIIEHYKHFPIILIDGKDKTGVHREQCYLTRPLPLNRLFSPW